MIYTSSTRLLLAGLAVWTAVGLTSCVGCGPETTQLCARDLDCPAGFICQQGAYTPPSRVLDAGQLDAAVLDLRSTDRTGVDEAGADATAMDSSTTDRVITDRRDAGARDLTARDQAIADSPVGDSGTDAGEIDAASSDGALQDHAFPDNHSLDLGTAVETGNVVGILRHVRAVVELAIQECTLAYALAGWNSPLSGSIGPANTGTQHAVAGGSIHQEYSLTGVAEGVV